MDEVEKYQQRLQAIAEKRRLQEEEDRAKRALGDEKLRMQQLKRKSLRDQWLMEGPPSSPDSAGPQSPLWGPKAQHMEANIDKLQNEAERLGKAVGRLQDHTENSSHSAKAHTDHHGNGQGHAAVTAGHPVEDREVTDITTSVTPSLTNGTNREENSQNAPLQDGLVHANGLAEGAITLTFLGFSEAEPGQGVCDDDSAIIRAERVIITDEGEEVTEVSSLEEPVEKAESDNNEEAIQAAETRLEACCDADQTGDAAVIKENNDTESNADAKADTKADTDGNVEPSPDTREDTSSGESSGNPDISCADVTAPAVKESAAESVKQIVLDESQPLTGTLGDTVEATRALAPSNQEHCAAAQSESTQQEALHPTASASNSTALAPSSPDQFQDISLDRAVDDAESSHKQPTDGQLVEPLLVSKPAAVTDTSSPNRSDVVNGPKTKTCQCCSVM